MKTWHCIVGLGAVGLGGYLWYRSSRAQSVGAMVRAARRSSSTRVTQGPSNDLGPNLGSGSSKKIIGTLVDEHVIKINGTVVVRMGSTVIGHVTSAAGSFSIYDLPAGTYKLTVTTFGGKSAAKNVTVPVSGSVSVGQIVVA